MDVSILTNSLKIDKIIQFGNMSSQANDIDLLVVSDDFKEVFHHKRKSIIRNWLQSNKHIDVICLTKNEYLSLKKSESPFYRNIKLGSIIYDSNK